MLLVPSADRLRLSHSNHGRVAAFSARSDKLRVYRSLPFDTGQISSQPRLVTKADIIDAVVEKVGGFSKTEAADAVESVFETVKNTLEKGEKIKVSGFGNFVVRDKLARTGRNPQTGQDLVIGARRVLTFRPSPVLKKTLNR